MDLSYNSGIMLCYNNEFVVHCDNEFSLMEIMLAYDNRIALLTELGYQQGIRLHVNSKH